MTSAARGRLMLAADFVRFQLAWFACVLLPHPADIAAGVALLVLHLRLVGERGEWRIVASAFAIGLVVDSALSAAGVLRFPHAMFAPLAPLWLLLLWSHFAATLRHSLGWLASRPLLSAALGAIAGPAAYFGGAALTDKAEIAAPTIPAAATLVIVWSAACVILPRTATFFSKNNSRRV